ncbi:MAG TPA: transaldolase [Anaerolineales bacterium]|jgi:transaldolase
MTNRFRDLAALGQSLWYDNIQRRLLLPAPGAEQALLAGMIERGEIQGLTSDPTIFHNAIAGSNDYDHVMLPLALFSTSAEQIFWQIAIEDIRLACDLFQPLYQRTSGGDGYVSLEVDPFLANDTGGTVAQARQLWTNVDRPNLMIRIPATRPGIPAIRQVIAAGINVNVTLIFSLERYQRVMEAYLDGLEDCLLSGGDIENIHSVASFFVSPVDSSIDPLLPDGSPLRGKTAIANAKLAYDQFRVFFAGPRFGKLQLAKANFQRPLWASTGTKNLAYSDTLFVDGLIGPATVNTLPPATLEAFRDHGCPAMTLLDNVQAAREQIEALEELGISMQAVSAELEAEGLHSFQQAFSALLQTIDQRRAVFLSPMD